MFDAGSGGEGSPGAEPDPPVTVLVARSRFEAQVAAELLRAEGIPWVGVLDEALDAIGDFVAMYPIEVRVPASYAEAARFILERTRAETAAEDHDEDL